MRETIDKFKVNGKPILAPDAGIAFDYEDLDDSTTGRDEGGYMHRFVLRYKVGKWGFSYETLTDEERAYMEGLFSDQPTFEFTHPDRIDSSKLVTTICYRSKVGFSWYNAKTGLWKNYKFNVVEC